MHRSTARAVAIVLSLALGAAASPLALAPSVAAAQGDAVSDARRYIEGRHNEVRRLLRNPASPERNAQLTALLDGLLDYPELAKRSLGNKWSGLTPAQRTQFSELLEALVARNYQENLESTASFNITTLGAEAHEDYVIVRTRAQDRRNRRAQPVDIDYTTHKVGGHWRVFDVHTDGISLVLNYRSQFTRIIDRDGFDGLIEKMQNKLDGGS